jgi:hypothetical protein
LLQLKDCPEGLEYLKQQETNRSGQNSSPSPPAKPEVPADVRTENSESSTEN